MPDPFPIRSIGDPNSSALVFIHGFLGRGEDWAPIAQALAPEYHCLLVDLPWHGANTFLSPDSPLTFDSLEEGLIDTLATSHIERPALIGYSLGGRVALHAACRFPDHFSALVLESASPGLRSETEREERRRLDDARAAGLLEFGLPAFLEDWYRADLWASLRARPELFAKLVRDRAESGAGDGAAGAAFWAAKALADLSTGRMDPLWDRLPDLRLPVLLLSGDLDPKYTAITAETAALIPGAVHERIPEAGHNIHLEQPQEFISALRNFLSGIFLASH